MSSSTAADVAAFRSAAVSGMLGVDPDAARAVLSKIRAGKDQVEALIRTGGGLAQPPKLGANEVGANIAAKFSDRAVGGGESYAAALHTLYTQYDQVEQAIELAMRQYEQFDTDAADTFRTQA